MKMIIQQLVDEVAQKRETLATVEYASSKEIPSVIGFVHNVKLLNGKELEIRANYAALNNGFMVLVLFEGKQIFTAAAQWDKVTPFLAFRISDGSYVELYFEK